MKTKKAKKQNVRYLEEVICRETGHDISSWFRYVFSSFGTYCRFVERRFRLLSESDQKRIQRIVLRAKKRREKKSR